MFRRGSPCGRDYPGLPDALPKVHHFQGTRNFRIKILKIEYKIQRGDWKIIKKSYCIRKDSIHFSNFFLQSKIKICAYLSTINLLYTVK